MQRITNPHPTATELGRIQSNLDQHIFDYFFRYIYPGNRGNRQALINTFFQALYDQCQLESITASYDPTGESHARVLDILSRLNFRDDVQLPTALDQGKSDPAKRHGTGRTSVLRSKNT